MQEYPEDSEKTGRNASGGDRSDSGDGINIDELYEDVALLCFQHFGMTSFDQVDRVTIAEYEVMLRAVQSRNEDLDYIAHWQAFLNYLVQSTKKNGQPVYRKFRSFYKPPKQETPQESEGRFSALAEYKRQKIKEQEENGKL